MSDEDKKDSDTEETGKKRRKSSRRGKRARRSKKDKEKKSTRSEAEGAEESGDGEKPVKKVKKRRAKKSEAASAEKSGDGEKPDNKDKKVKLKITKPVSAFTAKPKKKFGLKKKAGEEDAESGSPKKKFGIKKKAGEESADDSRPKKRAAKADNDSEPVEKAEDEGEESKPKKSRLKRRKSRKKDGERKPRRRYRRTKTSEDEETSTEPAAEDAGETSVPEEKPKKAVVVEEEPEVAEEAEPSEEAEAEPEVAEEAEPAEEAGHEVAGDETLTEESEPEPELAEEEAPAEEPEPEPEVAEEGAPTEEAEAEPEVAEEAEPVEEAEPEPEPEVAEEEAPTEEPEAEPELAEEDPEPVVSTNPFVHPKVGPVVAEEVPTPPDRPSLKIERFQSSKKPKKAPGSELRALEKALAQAAPGEIPTGFQKRSVAAIRFLSSLEGTERAMVLTENEQNEFDVAAVGGVEGDYKNLTSLRLLKSVFLNKEPLMLIDVRKDLRFHRDQVLRDNEVRSIVCVPFEDLVTGTRGLLYADNVTTESAFTYQDLRKVEAFAKLLKEEVDLGEYEEKPPEEPEELQTEVEPTSPWVWVILAVAAIVIVVPAIMAKARKPAPKQTPTITRRETAKPQTVLTGFIKALESRSLAGAYQFLSPERRSKLSIERFQRIGKAYLEDEKNAWTLSRLQVHKGGTATENLETFELIPPNDREIWKVVMQKEEGSWYVHSIKGPLEL